MNEKLNNELSEFKSKVYDKCAFQVTDFKIEEESKEYGACQFELNGLKVICRNAKKTPKKDGRFVTFWKRKEGGPIEPFCETDPIVFFVVNIQNEGQLGQFVFPRSVLIKKGIISTNKKEGKRAFRVYTPSEVANSKQAERTQKWQQDYFLGVENFTDLERAKELYSNK